MLAKKFLSLLKFKDYRSQNKSQSRVIRAGTLLTALNALQFEAFYSQNFSSQLLDSQHFFEKLLNPKTPSRHRNGIRTALLYFYSELVNFRISPQ